MEEQFWSLCVAKGITVISRAKSSEQDDDKTNNSDDVILRQGQTGQQINLTNTTKISWSMVISKLN